MLKKRVVSGLLMIVMVAALLPSTVMAAKDVTVYVDGSQVYFDQAPIIENGRTLVPLRAIFEKLGASVDWNNSTRTVTATQGDITIKLTIGEDILYKNGQVVKIDCPAKIVNSRTLVPVRAIAESFGCDVKWNGEERKVDVVTENSYNSENNDVAYEKLKNAIINKANVNNGLYTVEIPFRELYNCEIAGKYVFTYSAKENYIECGSLRENGKYGALLKLKPTLDTFRVVLVYGGEVDQTEKIKRSAVTGNIKEDISMETNNIVRAYKFIDENVNKFLRITTESTLIETDVALAFIGADVTLNELGFTQLQSIENTPEAWQKKLDAFDKLQRWVKENGVYRDGVGAIKIDEIDGVGVFIVTNDVGELAFYLVEEPDDFEYYTSWVFKRDERFYMYNSSSEYGSIGGEGVMDTYTGEESCWYFENFEIPDGNALNRINLRMAATHDLKLLISTVEENLLKNNLPTLKELGFARFNAENIYK